MTTDEELEHLKFVIRTLIVWIARSANSPLSISNAEALIKLLDRIEAPP